jgi:hypothetical protein
VTGIGCYFNIFGVDIQSAARLHYTRRLIHIKLIITSRVSMGFLTVSCRQLCLNFSSKRVALFSSGPAVRAIGK